MYRDRIDAGQRLARLLEKYREGNPLVLALPRGGAVVGSCVAQALDCPLDVIVARKLGAPQQPEFGFGAVAPDGVCVIDQEAVRMLGLADEQVEEIVAAETAEMQRRAAAYRGDQPPLDIAGRTAILVDDGLATGVTARAAIAALRRAGPRQLVLAVPVAPPDTAAAIRPLVDDLICPLTPAGFRAVGQWYENFEQTSDYEVIELLRQNRQQRSRRS